MSTHIQSPYSDSDHTESPLDFPVPQVPEDEDTVSLRTELLSGSSSARDNVVATVDSRRERRRTSERHRSDRERELARVTHRRDLVAMLLDEEAESKKLKKALLTAVTRFQAESQRVVELERDNRGVTDRFRILNESKVAAELQASQALQELEIYKLQLENAQREILRAQEAMRVLERQVADAEASAARAREKARKLKTQQVISLAKEEGRRLGFEEGLRRGQDEFRNRLAQAAHSVPPPPPPALTQPSSSQQYDNPTLTQGESTVQTAEDDDVVSTASSSSASSILHTSANHSTVPQPQLQSQQAPPPEQSHFSPPQPSPPSQQEAAPGPGPGPNLGPPPASLMPGVPMSNKSLTPSVQRYEIDIPPTDVLRRQFGHQEDYHRQPRHEWVTAVKHSEINGLPPSPQTARIPSNAQAGPSNLRMGPPGPMPPASMPPGSMSPYPIMVPPAGPMPASRPSPSPIKSAGIRWASVRRPSLRGAKASSWYRSFSFRKKNKQVIDPDPEEEIQEEQLEATQPPPPITGEAPDEGRMYKYHPPAPQSWYQGSKPPASLKAPSRRAASIDSGSTRSTRISNYTILGTPHAGPSNRAMPNGMSSGASTSGRSAKSANKRLNQKESYLSIIKEDPASRGTTPMNDRYHSGPGRPRAASDTGSVSRNPLLQPDFDPLRGQPKGKIAIEFDPSKPPPRHRPTNLVFPSPLSPQPQAAPGVGASLHPESARLDRQGSRSQRSPGPTPTTGGTIGISVQPPSQSASPSEARMSVPQSSNYLSPNSTRVPLPQPVNTAPLSFNNTPSQNGALPSDFGQHLSPRAPSARLSMSGGRRASPMMNSVSLPNAPSPHRPSVGMTSPYQGNAPPMSRSNTPKIFQAQQLDESSNPQIFQGVPRAESVRSTASRPTAAAMVPPGQATVVPNSLTPGDKLTRVASNNSLRSNGPYTKFDNTTYDDPGFWGPDGPSSTPSRPPSAASAMAPQQLSRRHSRALSAYSALSYMTDHASPHIS